MLKTKVKHKAPILKSVEKEPEPSLLWKESSEFKDSLLEFDLALTQVQELKEKLSISTLEEEKAFQDYKRGKDQNLIGRLPDADLVELKNKSDECRRLMLTLQNDVKEAEENAERLSSLHKQVIDSAKEAVSHALSEKFDACQKRFLDHIFLAAEEIAAMIALEETDLENFPAVPKLNRYGEIIPNISGRREGGSLPSFPLQRIEADTEDLGWAFSREVGRSLHVSPAESDED